jgi:NADPH2:quinone reductase
MDRSSINRSSSTPLFKMMKALLVKSPSSDPSPEVADVPIPTPKPGEVLIKVHAAAINPSDALNAVGAFPYTTFPRILGRDFAGVVEDGPQDLIGKHVYGTSGNVLSFSTDGCHAEYCVAPSDAVAMMPECLSFRQAATVGVPYTTAWITLERARTTSSDIVLVLGATGSVGSAAVQIAHAKGCTVLSASRRDTTDVNLLKDPQLATVSKLTQGHGADVIIDTVGDPILMRAALGVLAIRGRLSYITAPRNGSTEFTYDMLQLYRKEQIIVGCNSLVYTGQEMAVIMSELTQMLDKGTICIPEEGIVEVGLNENAVAAYLAVRGRTGKKFVITVA